MPPKLTWTDVEDLGLELAEKFPDRDPFSVRFTELREMVEALDDFDKGTTKHVNESILEAIQVAWNEERDPDTTSGGDDEKGYKPPAAFRPD
ncbi:MAG: Fe-S cluster assembly protein IscX [Phycisphaera sp.]|nr:Fe-S cluster assembly protein IscX [Phycisphaera sp.]